MKRTNEESELSDLSKQMKRKTKKDKEPKEEPPKYEGNDELVVSTGSTLLDLAISGGRIRGGGIPAGIFVEVFGPSSTGKTVLLCEIAGGVQRKGGEIMFKDPEARLDKQFAKLFDFDVDEVDYDTPDTVPEVFEPIRGWEPEDTENKINGIFADSLAALSTDMEMEGDDAYGARRAKEFSEQLRRTCRTLMRNNLLLVGSNQVRVNMNSGPFGEKYNAPGGEALGFYSSLRLRFKYAKKIKKKKKVAGKTVKKVIGIETEVEVYKSSVWKPHNTATITILFDYGIDSIRDELQFIKDYTSNNVYTLDGADLHNSMDKSIRMVEKEGKSAIKKLRKQTIDLWEEIQQKFEQKRKPKPRFE